MVRNRFPNSPALPAVARLVLALATAFGVLAGGGCSSMKPGSMSAVQPVSDAPRAGNAYLLRGWIGIFSTGIDHLTEKVNEAGVRAHVFQDDQWRTLGNTIAQKYRNETVHEPIVLIGHSYGADDVIRIARMLHKEEIEVELLVTLDPVTPPKVPGNVKKAVNLYQSNGVFDAMPFLRGVAVAPDDPGPRSLVQWDIRKERQELLEPGTDHFNIEKKGKIHDEVVKHVLAACPPRPVWVAQLRQRLPGYTVENAPVRANPSAERARAAPVASPAKGVTVSRRDDGIGGGDSTDNLWPE